MLTENSIYRNVRRRAIDFGFRFTDQDPFHYRTCPLLCLTEMMKTRTLVYIDTARAIEGTIKKTPGAGLKLLECFADNYLLHETAHGIASHILPNLYQSRHSWSQSAAFNLALSESFAMATEALAQTEASSALHILFLKKNSYSAFEPERVELLRNSISALGCELTFQILMTGYLYANFLYSEVPPDSRERILRTFGADTSSTSLMELVPHLLALGQTIGLGFRIGTAEIFLESLGVKKDPTTFFDFNPENILTSPKTRRTLHLLYECLFSPLGTISVSKPDQRTPRP